MAENKINKWIKLQSENFRDKAIKKIKTLDKGDTYALIYFELLALTVEDDGVYYFEGFEKTVVEELALDLDRKVEDISKAIDLFVQYNLVEIKDYGLNMLRIDEMVGSETEAAKRVRKSRALKKSNDVTSCNNEVLHKKSDVTNCNNEMLHKKSDVTKCNAILEKEKEEEEDKEKEKEEEYSSERNKRSKPIEPEIVLPPVISIPLNDGSFKGVTQQEIDEWQKLYPAVDVMQQLRSMAGWCKSNPQKRKTKSGVNRFINAWLSREQDKPHYSNRASPASSFKLPFERS